MPAIWPAKTERLVHWLANPQTFPDRPAAVDVIETHISWVFLTRLHAYKLKKPVRFEFLDFSTVELRRAACEEEVRLNARLAPQVYLGLVPILEDVQGRYHLGSRAEKGSSVDWLVHMQRLPAERRMDVMIRSASLRGQDIRAVAALLGEFYRRATPIGLSAEDYRREIERHVRANRQELLNPVHELPGVIVKRIHAGQLRTLRLSPELLDRRLEQGRIVEGHGDLRPEHIYLPSETAPVVIDCVEFNRELRLLDVADELSFLAMECDALSAPRIGRRLIEQIGKRCKDQFNEELLAFYKSYRACVRAKVAVLRAKQVDAVAREKLLAQANQYLQLATNYTTGSPLVLVVAGLMGSGKSTLAAAVAEVLGAELLSTDRIRRNLFGASDQSAAYNAGIYRADLRERVYERLLLQVGRMLDDGLSVVLDGTFGLAASRRKAAAVAAERGATLFMLRCHCPDEVALARITQRIAEGGSNSEAHPELLSLQKAQFEPEDPASGLSTYEVDTTLPLDVQVQGVLKALC